MLRKLFQLSSIRKEKEILLDCWNIKDGADTLFRNVCN
jgi:hypothetical protein